MRHDVYVHFGDGPNNVTNAGIVHMGSRGPGTPAACGNMRAHMTFGKETFRELENQCARCAEKLQKWDEIRSRREQS